MIRKLRTEDIDNAVSIWFEASIKAHNFISEEFWSSQKQNMRELYLPNCESWVYESEGKLIGFVSYYEGSIPAIFVDPDCQSRGLGTQLLNHVKSMYNKLTLTVYVDNESTYRFYQHHGFIDLDKCICEHTGKQQMEMCWENAGS